MQSKIPFYKASHSEILKISVAAILGALISLGVAWLLFLFTEGKIPSNSLWLIFMPVAIVGFSCGLSFYRKKYSRLVIAGATAGLLTGLFSIIFFSEIDLILRIPTGLLVGSFYAGISAFIIWAEPEWSLHS